MPSDTFPFAIPRTSVVPSFGLPASLRWRPAAAAVVPFHSGSRLMVETLDFDAASAHLAAWKELALRALEPNLYNEPACALTAAQHLPDAHRPRFIFVWEPRGDETRAELLAVCPLRVPGRLDGRSLIRTWTHTQAPLATPLIDATRGHRVMDALAGFCAQRHPEASGIVFGALPRHGATVTLLEAWARASGRSLVVRAARGGTVVRSVAGVDIAALSAMRSALEKNGRVTYSSLRHPSDVRFGVEAFLTFDAAASDIAGPEKLLYTADVTTFVRSLTRRLAAEGKCRIDRLMIDDRTVAMGIVFEDGVGQVLWRVALDPAYDPLMLQGQLVLEAVRAHKVAPVLTLADARGAASRRGATVWPGATVVCDAVVALDHAQNRACAEAIGRDAAWSRVRSVFRRGSVGKLTGAKAAKRRFAR